MKKYLTIFAVFALLGLAALLFTVGSRSISPGNAHNASLAVNAYTEYESINPGDMIDLPKATTRGPMSLEEALLKRRSVRNYHDEALKLSELGQLLWSAQGITNERGFRTAPSAGATFPLEVFAVVTQVEGLSQGIYHYRPQAHQLEFVRPADVLEDLFRACLSQSMILDAGAILVFAADFARTTGRYGQRGERYVHNEIGHAGQNVHLQAAALDLGTVVIGAYRDEEVEDILRLGEELRVLYLMPVGKM